MTKTEKIGRYWGMQNAPWLSHAPQLRSQMRSPTQGYFYTSQEERSFLTDIHTPMPPCQLCRCTVCVASTGATRQSCMEGYKMMPVDRPQSGGESLSTGIATLTGQNRASYQSQTKFCQGIFTPSLPATCPLESTKLHELAP